MTLTHATSQAVDEAVCTLTYRRVLHACAGGAASYPDASRDEDLEFIGELKRQVHTRIFKSR